MKHQRPIISILFLCALLANSGGQTRAQNLVRSLTGWRAGLAKVVITPQKPMWLAGYATRNKPSQGKLTELYAKAIAIEDKDGRRVVIVTTDLLGLPAALSEAIAEGARQRYNLQRAQLLLNSSHTHTGPVLRSSLVGAYELPEEQAALITDYNTTLQAQIIALIGQALADLQGARLSLGHGTARFGVNRRVITPEGVKGGVNLKGLVDHDVPVLRVEAPEGRLRAVLFGYACHNTTLTGEFYEFSGDYAGFAQQNIEALHPGAMALFVMGAGADINPHPRSKLELAQEHGLELAYAVEQILRAPTPLLRGPLKYAFERVALPLAPPSREEFKARLQDENAFRRRHAERWLARYERDGKVLSEYQYPVQLLQFGNDLTIVALAGEVVVDYALRLKRMLGADSVWLAGYSNDVFAYVPSERILKEGGYEGGDAMIYYDLPGPFAPGVEERIFGKINELLLRLKKMKIKSDFQ